ncbi:VPS23 [Auxenochlorella protothecoides x Auxenochlorella symbiontica]
MAPGSLYLLSEALGRTGANALPYGDDFKFAVRQQVQEVLTEIPSLKVKVDDYTHHTGRTQSLLLLEGTIPMYYQTVKYNIPVAVWLPEQFPLAPPIVYVVPTPDMMIKPGHSVVDPSGSVASLYLENWLYPGSNLRILAEDMSICFGSDPPLFTKPPGWTPDGAHKPGLRPSPSPRPLPAVTAGGPAPQPVPPPPPPTSEPEPFHNPLVQGATSRLQSLSMGTSPRPASSATPPPPVPASGFGSTGFWAGPASPPPPPPAAQASSSGYGAAPAAARPAPRPPPPPSSAEAEATAAALAAAFRSAAAIELQRRLAASLGARRAALAAQLEEATGAARQLAARRASLAAGVARLQAERLALDATAHELAAAGAALARWLADAEARGARGAGAPDAAIVPADDLSAAALAVQAQDLATEDALYVLDGLLNRGGIAPEAYLKQVRSLCRQQFMLRALGNKIAAAQEGARGARVSPPRAPPNASGSARDLAAAASGYLSDAVAMPLGDGWANTGILSNPLVGSQAQQRGR